MALADRTIKRGDSFPPHVRVLTDDEGVPLDLPAGAAARIVARKDAATLITSPVDIVTVQEALDTGWLEATDDELFAWATHMARRGGVVWDIDPADTAIAGAYPYEYQVTYNASEPDPTLLDIETVPGKRSQNPVLTIDEDMD